MSDQTPETQAPVQARACRACHAPLQDTQEWCLTCGAAVNKSGGIHGKRAAATVAALTLVLSGGAVAAAYAALTNPDAPPQQLAQAVPGGTPDTIPTTTQTETDPALPTTPTLPESKLPSLPEVDDSSDDLPAIPSVPSLPDDSSTSTGSTTSTGTTTTNTTTTNTTTTPTSKPKVVDVKLTPDDIGPYDPDARVVSPPSNRAKLFDKDETTSWTASAAAGETTLGFGVTVDLQDPAQVASLTLAGQAGGIEVYGTSEAELPQSIADSGWTKIGDVKELAGEKKITFSKSIKKFDMILVWFTTAPAAGPTVSLSSLAVSARQ